MVSQDDFTTTVRLTEDLGVTPDEDITPAVNDALSTHGDSTLIIIDRASYYDASDTITVPQNVDEWGLYAPPGLTDTVIGTNSTLIDTDVHRGLFGGFLVVRDSITVTDPAANITATPGVPNPALDIDTHSTGQLYSREMNRGDTEVRRVGVEAEAESAAVSLSAGVGAVLTATELACENRASTPTGIAVPPRHEGQVSLTGCRASRFGTGINAANAPGAVTVEYGDYLGNVHGIRMAGRESSIERATLDAVQPGGAAIVWDAGTPRNSGGEIRDCEIVVDGGRSAIAAAAVSGGCSIRGGAIVYESVPDSPAERGAVIDAPPPTPSDGSAQDAVLPGSDGWEVDGTRITGDGEPTAVVWLTDRPDSRTANTAIEMRNTDGVIYDGESSGTVENAVINVWGTTAQGTMTVSNINQTATVEERR